MTKISDEWPMQRNLSEHRENMLSRNKRGCIKPSLTQIPPGCAPPDHLHMRKAIISKLFSQLTNNL